MRNKCENWDTDKLPIWDTAELPKWEMPHLPQWDDNSRITVKKQRENKENHTKKTSE